LEYGANDSIDASADGGIEGDRYFLGVDGGYSRSNGISAYAPGTEDDGFRQWRIGGRGSFDLVDGLALVASARHADSRIEFDGYPAPTYAFADTPEYQTTRQTSGRTGFEYDGSALALRGGLALSSTKRAYFDPTYGTAPGFETDGRSLRADLGGKADLGSGFALNFGGDSEWTRFSTTFDPRQTARLTSGHVLLGWSNDSLSLAAGGRLDDSDRFGSHWTFGANGAVQLGQGWRIKASYGEGFKAPTLYQLYGYGGNVNLAPEESRSYEMGVEMGDRNSSLHFAATVFQRDATNQIDYVWPSGYFNTRRTRATGLELEAGAKVTQTLSLRAAYSYI
jgi:vitamin B12 transporter